MIKTAKVWEDVIDFPGYKIDREGQIYSLLRSFHSFEILQRIDRAGYYTVRLVDGNGKIVTQYVHRLLAQTFVPNSGNNSVVNHINGIKTDNRVENLEWLSFSDNIKHAYDLGLISKEKVSRRVIDLRTGIEYPSIKEAAISLDLNYNTLRNMLNGYNKNTSPFLLIDR